MSAWPMGTQDINPILSPYTFSAGRQRSGTGDEVRGQRLLAGDGSPAMLVPGDKQSPGFRLPHLYRGWTLTVGLWLLWHHRAKQS